MFYSSHNSGVLCRVENWTHTFLLYFLKPVSIQAVQAGAHTHTHSFSLSKMKFDCTPITVEHFFLTDLAIFFLCSNSSCVLQMLSFAFCVLLAQLRHHKGSLIREYIKAYILVYILSTAILILSFLKTIEVNMINIDWI